MARMAAAFLACAACAIPGNAQHDPGLLELFLGRALESIVKQPDYTCLETIERIRQLPNGRQRVEDTLKLEVALVEGKEMFAWPGSLIFEDREVRDIVPHGMFGNGNFGLYARMLFNAAHPEFTYGGREALDGRTVARYDFRVPRRVSGYNLRVNEKTGVAGFHGSFYFDVGTLDLRRLEVIAFEIPEELGLTSAQDRIDYARIPIGDDSFVLPVESTLVMSTAGADGMVSRNRVRFSQCRKFTGESSLVFLDEDIVDRPVALPVPVREVEIPADTEVRLALRTLIDLGEGYAGAAVEAKLDGDIKSGRTVLAPKGAIARGRIVRLERHPDLFALGVRFTDLEWKGGHAKLNLEFDRALFLRGVIKDLYTGDILIDRTVRRLNDVLLVWRTK